MLHVDTPRWLHALDEVPTDRRVALRLLWLLDDPHARLDAITHVISADPSLSVRILALANASPACEAGGITSLPRAVSVLGARSVQAIASTAVLNLFSNRPELPEQFWLHSITAGVAAARVAFHMHLDPSEALTAGLLHDFGEQLLRDHDPDRFDEMTVSAADHDPTSRLAIEREVFGTDHATLGAEVLSNHGLPTRLVDALRDHHAADLHASPLTRVVSIADCIAKIIDGDTQLDLDSRLASAGIDVGADRVIEQTEIDRLALVKFLAADFQAPRSTRR